MLRAVLQYNDYMQEGRNVFRILANNSVAIIKTSRGDKPKITIIVKDYHHLNDLVRNLNRDCTFEVRVVKTKMIKEKTNEASNTKTD
jgi:hypothetical protein